MEHGKDDLYDVFTVSEVMSTPPVVVREKERASHLVKILKSTTHNGYVTLYSIIFISVFIVTFVSS